LDLKTGGKSFRKKFVSLFAGTENDSVGNQLSFFNRNLFGRNFTVGVVKGDPAVEHNSAFAHVSGNPDRGTFEVRTKNIGRIDPLESKVVTVNGVEFLSGTLIDENSVGGISCGE
jgi:hypothetical protein